MYIVEMKGKGEYNRHIRKDSCQFFYENLIQRGEYIPKANGETTEVDVILIHETGIYVIGSKNYKGWIFGSEEQKNWTQTLSAGRNGVQKYHFYNPVIQNKVHIKWIKEYLKMRNLPIYSYIVFGNNATLKSINVK